MHNAHSHADKPTEVTRCFAIIAITTTLIVIVDTFAHAFFFEQTERLTPYLPMLIGGIALIVMGLAKRKRRRIEIAASQSNTASTRRVRVTGPIK